MPFMPNWQHGNVCSIPDRPAALSSFTGSRSRPPALVQVVVLAVLHQVTCSWHQMQRRDCQPDCTVHLHIANALCNFRKRRICAAVSIGRVRLERPQNSLPPVSCRPCRRLWPGQCRRCRSRPASRERLAYEHRQVLLPAGGHRTWRPGCGWSETFGRSAGLESSQTRACSTSCTRSRERRSVSGGLTVGAGSVKSDIPA